MVSGKHPRTQAAWVTQEEEMKAGKVGGETQTRLKGTLWTLSLAAPSLSGGLEGLFADTDLNAAVAVHCLPANKGDISGASSGRDVVQEMS